MRLLRFDFRDDLASVDLHPLLTVVSGLEPGHKRQLFEAVRRLSTGSTVGLRALVEHQGLLVELDAGTGDPLGSITTTAPVLVYVDGLAIEGGEAGLEAEIAQWERQAAIDAVTVEEIRSDLDLGVRARLAEVRDRQCGKAGGLSEPPRLSSHQLQIDSIRLALDKVRSMSSHDVDCPPPLKTLLDRWDAYRQRLQIAEEHLFQLAVGVQQAEAAVLDRTRALQAAEAAVGPISDTRFARSLVEGPEPAHEAAVLAARAALDAAMGDLQRARTAESEDAMASALKAELEQLRSDCRPVLGSNEPDDIGQALSSFMTKTDNPEWLAAVNELRDALSSNGVQTPFGLDPDELAAWTDSWLGSKERLLAEAVRENRLAGSLDESPADSEVAVGRQVDELLRTELDHLLARHNRALAQIEKAELRATASARRVGELRAQLTARTTEPRVATAADVLAMVAPVAERILLDVGGSLPVAVVGDMDGLPSAEIQAMMGAFEEVARQVQIIVVSANREIAAWADQVGLERAAAVGGARALT